MEINVFIFKSPNPKRIYHVLVFNVTEKYLNN